MVRLYPAAHRRLFGEQMLQTFQDHYRDAVASGEESARRFWLGVIADEAKAISRARLASLGGTLLLFLAALLPVAGWTTLAAVALSVPFVLSQVQFLPALSPRSLVTDLERTAIGLLIVSLILVAIPLTLALSLTLFRTGGRMPILWGLCGMASTV
jgi:hypothetical protein